MLSDITNPAVKQSDDLFTAVCECGNLYYTDGIHVWTKCGWCKEVDNQSAGVMTGISLFIIAMFVVAWLSGPNP